MDNTLPREGRQVHSQWLLSGWGRRLATQRPNAASGRNGWAYRQRRALRILGCVLLFCLGHSLTGLAQDRIQRRDTTSIQAKVLAVVGTQIFYKPWDAQDGPTMVLGTGYVQHIVYQNGTRQEFSRPDAAPSSVLPPPFQVQPVNQGRNVVSVMPIDLLFGNATLAYERLFGPTNRVGVKVPLTVGLRQQEPISRYQNNYLHNKLFSSGVEINFYTTPAARFRYFIGPAFQYGRFHYLYAEEYLGVLDFFGLSLGKVYGNYRQGTGQHFAVLLNNGICYQLGKQFVFTANGGVGWRTNVLDKTRKNLDTGDVAGTRFKVSGNLSVGCQF